MDEIISEEGVMLFREISPRFNFNTFWFWHFKVQLIKSYI
jgi:hypothetical protein